MVPNLYANFAHSETTLGDYMKLQSRKSSLSLKGNEVINLVVSQVNQCQYCLVAHTLLGQKAGFTTEQIVDIRRGKVDFDAKLNASATFVQSVAANGGHISDGDRAAILDAGYTEGNIVDIVVAVGDKTITNYLHAVTEVPIDFPAALAICSNGSRTKNTTHQAASRSLFSFLLRQKKTNRAAVKRQTVG